MRRPLLVLSIIGIVASKALGQSVPESKMAVPVGTLVGNLYSNEGLELKFQVPDGWVGSTDSAEALVLDSKSSNSAINTCSRAFLTIRLAGQGENQFRSTSQMMVIDPSCFSGVEFPKTLSKENWNQPFIQVMVKTLSHSPFMSVHGADIDGFTAGGRLFITLSGDDQESIAGHVVHVNHLVVFTESKGYWVAWMTRADDSAKEVLEKSNIQFLEH